MLPLIWVSKIASYRGREITRFWEERRMGNCRILFGMMEKFCKWIVVVVV